ncbi:hypothetical protein DPMN_101547 [Dreissena polymorpha]|uniref:Uncharacterized protein n=1 Tax=Dreissena polymorpha TaxID=45954 RepID=A0A9D4LJM9_DREPO|nr:hypothetical protein DPMN_101547 [Dreissena polymorpha]
MITLYFSTAEIEENLCHSGLFRQCTSDDGIKENAPPPWGHVFQPTGTIFKEIKYIIYTNVLAKSHEDLKLVVASRMKNAPPSCGHVFQPTGTILKQFTAVAARCTKGDSSP